MIQLQEVSKHYKQLKAVNNISLQVNEGETLALLGTSGCGKTTTLRMINRLTDTTDGNIFFDGKNILDLQPEALRRNMGYVLQHIGLFPHYTVAENIAIVPKLLQWNKAKISQRTTELMEKLHLPASILSSYPNALSGGQQQRVGLARALAANPSVLLMDEPLGALDPLTRDSIRQEFLQLDELKKKTIVIVTHDVEEAFEMADRICLMNKGKIEQLGTAKDLLFNPATDFVKSFFNQQRLQLEMQSLVIADVWPLIENKKEINNAFEIPIASTIWSAIEMISKNENSTNQKWFANNNNQQKEISLENLMLAYSSYKNNRHE